MTIWEKQIFILKELRELGANIQPVGTHDFQDNVLIKKLKPEEIKTCYLLLEKKNFVKTESNVKFPGIFATFITDEGMEEIERYEDAEQEKNRIKEIQNQQFYLTIILAISAAIASIYYLIEISKYFHHCN
jgi:hypothetical protein